MMRAAFPATGDLDRALALLGLGEDCGVRETQLLLHPCGGGEVLPVCLIGFDATAFTPDMFPAFRLDRPERVAASVHKRQAEFFFGRMAARAGMLLHGLPARDVPVGPHRQPLWPKGLTGSISHTPTWAAATIVADTDVSGVGIDIEAIVRTPEARDALVETVFDRRELEYLGTLRTPHDIETLLTLGFSAKEAFFKATFGTVGRFFDFSAAQMGHVDAMGGSLDLTLQESLCDAFQSAQRCRVGYRLFQDTMVLTGFAW